MKLYFSPGACSFSVNIALRKAGLPFEMVKVDLKTKVTKEGNYLDVNPKGYVPALLLDDGTLLTEANVILRWIADQVPAKKLFPQPQDKNYYHALEMLNFVATELHKGFSMLFHAYRFNEEGLKSVHAQIQSRINILDAALENKKFLLGDDVSIVDLYVFNILRWAPIVKLDISAHTPTLGLMERIHTLDAVQEALKSENPLAK